MNVSVLQDVGRAVGDVAQLTQSICRRSAQACRPEIHFHLLFGRQLLGGDVRRAELAANQGTGSGSVGRRSDQQGVVRVEGNGRTIVEAKHLGSGVELNTLLLQQLDAQQVDTQRWAERTALQADLASGFAVLTQGQECAGPVALRHLDVVVGDCDCKRLRALVEVVEQGFGTDQMFARQVASVNNDTASCLNTVDGLGHIDVGQCQRGQGLDAVTMTDGSPSRSCIAAVDFVRPGQVPAASDVVLRTRLD